MQAILREHAPATPEIVRAEPMESRDGAGFAELRWETRDLATSTPVQRTILITFTRVDAALLVYWGAKPKKLEKPVDSEAT